MEQELELKNNANEKRKKKERNKTFEIEVGCQNQFYINYQMSKTMKKNEKKIKNIHKKMMK